MDSIFRNKGGYEIRNSVDYIFLFEKTDVSQLWDSEKIKAWFLPLALDETVYYPSTKTKDIDILFVGSLYEKRIDLLEKVCQEFPKCTIKIYGHYYSAFRRPIHHLLRKNRGVFINKNITPERVNQLYNKSRICLNMHHDQTRYGVNQRFFEISGSKSFQLVDANPFIIENFPSSEVMTYHSFSDLTEKIARIISNQVDEDGMADKAYKKIIGNHTFTHRIQDMLKIIGQANVRYG